jgi:hypothetical protein
LALGPAARLRGDRRRDGAGTRTPPAGHGDPPLAHPLEPELATRERLPATALPRTLLDIAAACRPWTLNDAIERAERLDLLRLDEIDAMFDRRRGARGAARLRTALDIYRDPIFSRARSERLFLDLVKAVGLPRPAINFNVAGYEVDAYWPAERFAVEIDGWDAHRSRASFERDPLRQEALKLAGIDSIRITARRIEREPRPLGRRLGRLLQQRRQALSQA